MAKTNPIGVRFDQDKLDLIKKEQKLDSTQQVLNWLMDHYHDAKSWATRMSQTEKAIKEQPKPTITTTSSEPTLKGKGWFDEYRKKKAGL